MKGFVFIFLTIFAFASCGVEKPKHFIYGKWETKYSPKAVFTFGEDNDLESELFDADGKVNRKISYHFIIVDEKNVKVIYNEEGVYRLRIKVTAQADDEIWVDCSAYQTSARQTAFVDLPEICSYKVLRKTKE